MSPGEYLLEDEQIIQSEEETKIVVYSCSWPTDIEFQKSEFIFHAAKRRRQLRKPIGECFENMEELIHELLIFNLLIKRFLMGRSWFMPHGQGRARCLLSALSHERLMIDQLIINHLIM